jgi:hypothetical protein
VIVPKPKQSSQYIKEFNTLNFDAPLGKISAMKGSKRRFCQLGQTILAAGAKCDNRRSLTILYCF